MVLVHCRTGSSEVRKKYSLQTRPVHCRTGSSEGGDVRRLVRQLRSLPHRQLRSRQRFALARHVYVHCRTGSSEEKRQRASRGLMVHCRTGSSEDRNNRGWSYYLRSLPHRQLRRETAARVSWLDGSLPHRQLRRCRSDRARWRQCSLPHRQLRRMPAGCGIKVDSSLPHRQLRRTGVDGDAFGLTFTAAQAAQKMRWVQQTGAGWFTAAQAAQKNEAIAGKE